MNAWYHRAFWVRYRAALLSRIESHVAYRIEDWSELYAMVSGAAAVLTGLLFTALPLGPRQILKDPEHRGRAREAVFQLVALLVVAVFVLVPGQTTTALGAELVAVSVVMAVASVRFQSQTRKRFHAMGDAR
ncbi:hypothetical protein ABS735_05235 [Streptomyces sp. MMCC 100]|uniref:hypothetical protein n=1 Tax=Streptomyces sp. MMCC 100 TaxID=3163555 RepID=UPI0035965499